MPKLLIVGHTLPESSTTAAGKRILQLMELFGDEGYEIVFASTATPTKYSDSLEGLIQSTQSIVLNHSSFDHFIQRVDPDVVLFDRFMTEEQFGWRVARQCPDALRILDTEDLHFLRAAREKAVNEGGRATDANLDTDLAARELASIYRCDLSLIISQAEMRLLEERFSVPSFLLFYLPLFVSPEVNPRGFGDRADFVTIGNFRHRPNTDSVRWLAKVIWPLIRAKLPDARLHIFGAYATRSIEPLHDPANGFLLRGWAGSLSSALGSRRVCLAPLRFGAGLKGKILDALAFGTAVVTTPIGAEGIGEAEFPGAVSREPEVLAQQAVELYTSQPLWEEAQRLGIAVIREDFKKEQHQDRFAGQLTLAWEQLRERRRRNTTGRLLAYHGMQASRYLSKWIECKNELKHPGDTPETDGRQSV